MTQFREALLAELSEQVTQEPARPARRPARRWAVVAAGAAAAIVAVTTAVLLLPQQQEPAFALEKRPDGTFLLSWRDFSPEHFEEANRAMREAGARGKILQIGEHGSCPGYETHTLRAPDGPLPQLGRQLVDGEQKMRVPRMPDGATLLFMVNVPRPGSQDVAVSVLTGPVKDPAPPCVQFGRDAPPPSPSPS